METKATYLIAYDIVDNKVRNRVAEILKNYGTRLQKSLFECVLYRKELVELRSRLEALIDSGEDSIVFCPLCHACLEKRSAIGIPAFLPSQQCMVL